MHLFSSIHQLKDARTCTRFIYAVFWRKYKRTQTMTPMDKYIFLKIGIFTVSRNPLEKITYTRVFFTWCVDVARIHYPLHILNAIIPPRTIHTHNGRCSMNKMKSIFSLEFFVKRNSKSESKMEMRTYKKY